MAVVRDKIGREERRDDMQQQAWAEIKPKLLCYGLCLEMWYMPYQVSPQR